MPNVGPMELVVVLIIALIVLGPKRLPGAGRSLGKGIREFKESLDGSSSRADAMRVTTVGAEEPPVDALPPAQDAASAAAEAASVRVNA